VRRLKLCNSFGVPHPGGENVLYQAVYDNGLTVLVLVSIRGDQEVNEVKLHNELTNLKPIQNYPPFDVRRRTEMGGYSFTLSYIAPNIEDKYIQLNQQLHSRFLRLVDKKLLS